MSDGASAPPRRSRRWLTVALVVSLALNLLIVGLIAGAMLHGDRPHSRGAVLADLGYGPFVAALPAQARRDLARAAEERSGSLRQNRDAVRRQFAALLQQLRAAQFDAPAFSELLGEQQARLQERQQVGRQLLVDTIAAMTPAERVEFADRLERGFRPGPRPDRHRR